MTPIETYDRLISSVEAGDAVMFRSANRALFSTPCQDMELQLREENCRHAFKGSLDAALSLHEAILPGWHPAICRNVHHGTWTVCVQRVDEDGEPSYFYGDGPTCPARAFLLAILKAKRSELEADNG